ncbi:MAG: DUF5103 domain-containing protein [Bacteroidales bacterium]
MNSVRTILIIAFLTVVFSIKGFSQASPVPDRVYSEEIRTVLLYKEGWNLSNPVIRLNSDEKLVLGFDLLGDDQRTYYYSYIHCDRNWNESGVFISDYVEGLTEDVIEEYKASFNTKQHYFHYSLTFPGERMKPRLSGNYIIKVYEQGKPDEPVITKRFMITDESVSINATVHRPDLLEAYNTGQQVDFTVNFSGLSVKDPSRDISSVVLQNGNWLTARMDLKPDIIGNNEIRYGALSGKNVFKGGNEFRYFDIKNIRYKTEYIRDIQFSDNLYQVFLTPSEDREFKPYFSDRDLNGKYYVAVANGRDMDTDADYLMVYFTLPSAYKADGGDIYVSGALANWELNETNRMIYDRNKGQYQLSMLLKQGWYNYEYIFLGKGQPYMGPTRFEGSHFETENEYLILVYYRDPRDRYDRLAGSAVARSVHAGN